MTQGRVCPKCRVCYKSTPTDLNQRPFRLRVRRGISHVGIWQLEGVFARVVISGQQGAGCECASFGSTISEFLGYNKSRVEFRDKPNVQYCTCMYQINSHFPQPKRKRKNKTIHTTQRESLALFNYTNAIQSYSLLPSIQGLMRFSMLTLTKYQSNNI